MIWFKPLKLPCAGTPALIAQRLHTLASRQDWRLRYGPRGVITLHQPGCAWLRQISTPVFACRITPRDITPRDAPAPHGQTPAGAWQIRGHFRPGWPALSFMLGFSAFMLHTLWHSSRCCLHSAAHTQTVLGMLIVIPLIDWALNRPRMLHMHALLQQSLQAPVADEAAENETGQATPPPPQTPRECR